MSIIPFHEGNSAYFSPFINAFLSNDKTLHELYPSLGSSANYREIINSRKAFFNSQKRNLLADNLLSQYTNVECSEIVSKNIDSLRSENTFTVTTGQQIHLFLGPMFVLYKAIGTIIQARNLSKEFKDINVVPVFWMATEDHDIDEINYIKLRNQKVELLPGEYKGLSGTMPVTGIWEKIKSFLNDNSISIEVEGIEAVLRTAYTQYNNLADATRYLLNSLLGEWGILVVDANDESFKRSFIPIIKEDIIKGVFGEVLVEKTARLKAAGYQSIIPAKDINHFYIQDNQRYRIDREGDGFKLNGNSGQFSINQIEKEIEDNPQCFSPNVALRPLYQEWIMPNLAYVAGPSEVQYWVQLSGVFEKAGILAPALLLRPCIIEIPARINDWIQKNKLEALDFLSSGEQLKRTIVQIAVDTFELENYSAEFEVLTGKINSELFKNKSRQLKEFKQALEGLSGKLKKEVQELKEQKAASPEFAKQLEKAEKIREQFFNLDEPWERKNFIIEKWIFNDLNISELINNESLTTFGLLLSIPG